MIVNEIIAVNHGLKKVEFKEILEYHKQQNADATVAVSIHEIINPYGVIDLNDNIFIDDVFI